MASLNRTTFTLLNRLGKELLESKVLSEFRKTREMKDRCRKQLSSLTDRVEKLLSANTSDVKKIRIVVYHIIALLKSIQQCLNKLSTYHSYEDNIHDLKKSIMDLIAKTTPLAYRVLEFLIQFDSGRRATDTPDDKRHFEAMIPDLLRAITAIPD